MKHRKWRCGTNGTKTFTLSERFRMQLSWPTFYFNADELAWDITLCSFNFTTCCPPYRWALGGALLGFGCGIARMVPTTEAGDEKGEE